MSEVRHQLLITLVHGTWAHAFLWSRPLWFEEKSSFRTRLSAELGNAELGDIPHKIWPLLWSGANSIFVRDKWAHDLAEHLAAEHAEHPQATQLVIAHSHGGNIALRALHLLKELWHEHYLQAQTPAQVGLCADPDPFVITLATPFIELYEAKYFGIRPTLIRVAVIIATAFLSCYIAYRLFALLPWLPADMDFYFTVFAVISCFYWVRRVDKREVNRWEQIDALKRATQLGSVASAPRLLVIRAIDDEPSLVMALGIICNYVAAKSIAYILVLYWAVTVIGLLLLILHGLHILQLGGPPANDAARDLAPLILMLLGVLMVARTVHGRELALSPMECQINTQSTPDGVGAKIVTLVRRSYVKSLQHGIYDHEDCAKTISDWVRSQLSRVGELGT